MQQHTPLSPLMLGRPAQALALLAERLARHAERRLQQTGHRSIALDIRHPRLEPQACTGMHAPTEPRIELARETVQAYMAARYGFTATEALSHTQRDAPNGTETRITHALHGALRLALHDWLEMRQHGDPGTTQHSLGGLSWQWSAQIRIAEHAPQPLHITLDTAHGLRLEQLAAQLRNQARAVVRPPHTASPSAPLQIKLVARLLERQLTAAQLQRLQPGSVLPITLGSATVLLNDNAMLNASVAEHQGKLHLTDFETLE